jgi:uncharacterized DUF497 family protein
MTSARPFDFDPEKEAENLAKHGVGFDDGFAVLTQDDMLLWQFADEREDHNEDRWIVVGPLPGHLHTLLHVTWTERGDHIRIISVRRATPSERRSYANRYRRPD